MTSDSKLESTIDKILNQTEIENLSSLKKSFEESLEILTKSQSSLEEDYDRIIDEGKKRQKKLKSNLLEAQTWNQEINKFYW